MLFTDPAFVLLFAATALAFFLLPRPWRRGVLAASGLAFYGLFGPADLPAILLLIVAVYLVRGWAGVWVSAAGFAGLAVVYKLRAAGTGLQSLAIAGDPVMHRAVLPLGASFLAFELIHVAIERCRGTITAPSLARLAAFSLYAPCRIAGPIKRFAPFDRSIDDARWSSANLYHGLVRALRGLLKKVLVADVLALVVPPLNYWDNPLLLWGVLFAYAGYIYADFSAYSDIAIGLSRILGLSVPENFHAPYLARNIREFWSRWHISLSSWLGDYLFLPISKQLVRGRLSSSPRMAAVLGYLVTFAVCGLWHGLSWHFLWWGLYHGGLLSAYSLLRASGWPGTSSGWAKRIGPAACTALTFLAVSFGWALFAVGSDRAGILALRLLGWRG